MGEGKPKGSGNPPPVNPSDFTILKEGQAEILMHGNDVFYNKAQIVNRDLSIAIMKTFASKCKEEHLSRKGKRKIQSACLKSANGRIENVASSNDALINTNNSEEGKSSLQAEHAEDMISGNDVPSNASHLQEGDCRTDSVQVEHIEAEAKAASEHVESMEANIVAMKPLRILEALAASGLRALRYAREVEEVGSVVALDIDNVAVEACKRNIKLNGKIAISKVQAEKADSRMYMMTHEKEFDVVDIDPYGSPSVFLDSAVQSVADGGVLMCTATDMAVLCGNNGEVCYSKYGSYPVRGKYCHEMALRILLASIESHANRYKRYIVPVLSVSIDFYVRVFVRIFTSANAIKSSPSKLSYLYQCVGCDAFHLQPVGRVIQKNNNARYLPGIGPVIDPECKHCGKHFNMGGPIWSDQIHDPNWVNSTLKSLSAERGKYPAYNKVHAVLTAISEELFDVPLYVSVHSLSSTLKCTPPSASLFRYAVTNAGYRISGVHDSPLGLKTDAPMDVIWDIMRCWVKQHPVKDQPAETPGSKILSQPPAIEADFSKASSALSKARAKGVPRFLPNPEEFWGPKPRAGRQITSKHTPSLGLKTSPQKQPKEAVDKVVCEKPEGKRQKVEANEQSEMVVCEELPEAKHHQVEENEPSEMVQ